MAALFRISSLSALTASVLAPAYMAWLDGRLPFTLMALMMALFLLWRHRANIQRLLAGQEGHIGKKNKV